MSNSSFCPVDKTLSGATALSQSGPGSNGNEEIFHISLNSRAEASPSDCLVSYPGQSFERDLTPI